MVDPEVTGMLVRALRAVGRPEPESVAAELQEKLEACSFTSALSLCHTLNHADCGSAVMTDLRTIIKGPLLEALREASKGVMAQLRSRAPEPARGGLARQRIEIVRVDVVQVSAIDQRNQSFRASLNVQACLPGGNLCEHLRRCSGTTRPKKPSAAQRCRCVPSQTRRHISFGPLRPADVQAECWLVPHANRVSSDASADRNAPVFGGHLGRRPRAEQTRGRRFL